MKKLIIEFIGTMFFCLSIGMAAETLGALAPLAIGSTLMVMVYMGGHISGAHFNPAVTIAVLLRGKIGTGEAMKYWAAQIAGGLLGASIASWLRGEGTELVVGEGMDNIKALASEIIFTFALALVVLNVSTSRDTAGNSFYGLAIGFTFAAGLYAVAPISGGAFNPAVGIAHDVVAQNWSPLWIHIIGPLIGGAVAASVYKMTNED